MMNERDSNLPLALGTGVCTEVSAAKVCVVGAGGIGCELLKNLVLSGFKSIEVIDLDTIDVSNLNRQFLFRKWHFSVDYFKKFTIVFNALDNLEARRHVNRLCLAAEVPLIESGTTGDTGQVEVIKKGDTKCFDCETRQSLKTYPICTIRSTPSKPVHCIVWAKEFYKLLFGKRDESMMWEDVSETTSVYMYVQPKENDSKEEIKKYAYEVFSAIFKKEIEKKLSMSDMYKGAKRKPIPIDFENLIKTTAETNTTSSHALQSQRTQTPAECAISFIDCIVEMYLKNPNLRSYSFGIELQSTFKIKEIAGNIIPAVATTNAITAGLQVLEAFKILANSANANIEGECCKKVWILRERNRKKQLLCGAEAMAPFPSCYVCNSGVGIMELTIDTKTVTLQTLVDKVLTAQNGLAFNSPDIDMQTESGGIATIFESGEDGLGQEHLQSLLCDLPAGGIKEGVRLSVSDFSQDCSCDIYVKHKNNIDFDVEKYPEYFSLTGKRGTITTNPNPTSPKESKGIEDEDDATEVLEVIACKNTLDATESLPPVKGTKRKRSSCESSSTSKKQKLSKDSNDNGSTSTSGSSNSTSNSTDVINLDSDDEDGSNNCIFGSADNAIELD
eukprot:GSMAST32.ASY1.ANO1.192.1 assembled CDS